MNYTIGSFFLKSGDIKTIDRFGPDSISKIVKIISKKLLNFKADISTIMHLLC